MKLTSQILAVSLLALMIAPYTAAHTPPPPAATVAGVYEHFTIGKGSGDLEGMRVAIISAGGGYYAIVQIAQGGAEDPKPEFVEATVKGLTVTFTVGDQKFTGTASAASLRLKDPQGQMHVLKRKPCTSLFR